MEMKKKCGFNLKDKVVCINPEAKSYGMCGSIVCALYGGSYSVNFKNYFGIHNKTITFKGKNLMLKEEWEAKNNMSGVTGNYAVALVKFLSGNNTKKPCAFALFDKDTSVNDYVVCDTVHGWQVCQIVDIIPKDEYDGVKVTKEVICVIDITKYESRKKLRAKKHELMNKMESIAQSDNKMMMYQAIAERNPEMKELLDTFTSIVAAENSMG